MLYDKKSFCFHYIENPNFFKQEGSGSSPTFDTDPDPGKEYGTGGSGSATLVSPLTSLVDYHWLVGLLLALGIPFVLEGRWW